MGNIEQVKYKTPSCFLLLLLEQSILPGLWVYRYGLGDRIRQPVMGERQSGDYLQKCKMFMRGQGDWKEANVILLPKKGKKRTILIQSLERSRNFSVPKCVKAKMVIKDNQYEFTTGKLDELFAFCDGVASKWSMRRMVRQCSLTSDRLLALAPADFSFRSCGGLEWKSSLFVEAHEFQQEKCWCLLRADWQFCWKGIRVTVNAKLTVSQVWMRQNGLRWKIRG